MLFNYLKIAVRNLQRNSIYSIINITGLAIGITCSVLILLWVVNEKTYDRFHVNYEQLGQFWLHNEFSDNIASYNSVPLPLYEFMKTYDSRIKNTAIAHWPYPQLLTVGETKLNQEGQFVTPEFLEMFAFPFVKGSPASLTDAASIVLTESLAKTLFGDADAMNKTVLLDNTYSLRVTGILKDLPQNSSFQFKFLAPWAILAQQDWIKRNQDMWDDQSFQVFAELQPGVSMAEVNASIKNVIRQKEPDEKVDLFIHPLKDWHLRSQFKNGVQTAGMDEYVTGFTFIAVFILVIACINFMNLATARSEHRAREVGIRKSVGSRRSDLIWQFIGESVLITTVAFTLAIVLAELTLPLFNTLVGKKLFIHYASPYTWLLAIAFILITGLFAGSYPAFYLSSFNPVRVLKGKSVGNQAVAPRKFLVSLQFFFSICLIVSMVVIYKQIDFVKARDVGYNRNGLVMITSNEELNKNYNTLREQLLATGKVKMITTSSSPITAIYGNNILDWPGKPADREILFSRVFIGNDYAETMGIEMVEGRTFSQAFKSDTAAMILNEAALDVMGLQNPIGETISLWSRKWTVVGIMRDVLMSSPFKSVQPGFFLYAPGGGEVITLRLAETQDLAASLKTIETIFKELNPAYPFEYEFVDQSFEQKFATINMIGTLASVFASLAIIITCLGLLGLATFTAEQRTKEIGIRKVLGATNLNIVTLISKDFTRLVLVGFVFATPVAWYGLNYWLENSYSYRITIAWWVIPVAGLAALLLTLLIVATQALRAASANPTESLRSE
ncbi:MAG: ABC transporter permease [Cyclobacteriaceae bacterium]|nr:ABC transporter permease [Cyclobacteriaceae bacterium]